MKSTSALVFLSDWPLALKALQSPARVAAIRVSFVHVQSQKTDVPGFAEIDRAGVRDDLRRNHSIGSGLALGWALIAGGDVRVDMTDRAARRDDVDAAFGFRSISVRGGF
jgi:hypothetical protein